jgi:putative ABC transport system permease protein
MPNPIGSSVDVWWPGDFGTVARDAQRAQRFHFLMAVARVRDDAPLEAAKGQLRAIGERLGREFPQHNEGHLPNPVPLQYDDTEAVRGGLLLLMGAVACVLLIACANVANITLARGLSRIREFSVRAALGSSRRLLVRQMLVEQFCLATAGAAVGLLGAYWTLSALTGLERFGVPHTDQIRMDGRVLGFALILVLSATLLSALIPAFLTFRRDMFENLRTGGQGATLTRGGHRMRGALVVSQVGAATVLLFACALAIRSLGALLTVDTGFEAQAVWRFSATTPSTRYADADQIQTFQQQMLGRLRAIPGVVNASAAYAPPMENVSTTSVVLEGTVEPSPEIGYNAADGDYFQTLGIPLLAGRLMNIGDVNSVPAVAVVNRTMAERLWPGRSAIGQRVRTSTDANAEVVEVIGVVGDIRRQRIEEPPVAEMYYALTQDITRSPVYLVRLAPGVRPPLETIRSIVRELDPAIAVRGIAPLSATLEARSLARPGFIARLLGAFGGIALMLATIGTWGVIAALVAERRREIGIRKALGARDALIGRGVVGRGMAPVIGGVVLGGIGAVAAGRVIASGFYGVSALDPVALASVVTVLLLAGLAGCLGPARKAARLEPNLLMRESEVSG